MSMRAPSLPAENVFGRLRRLSNDPLAFFTQAATLGDVVHAKVGLQNVLLLGNPEHIREVLVGQPRNFTKDRGIEATKPLLGEGLLSSEGEFHKRQRRLAQPAFHHARISAYGQVMAEHAHRTQERWQDGAGLEVVSEMMRLALGVVAKTLFDSDVEGQSREIGEALSTCMEMFTIARVPFSHILHALPLPSTLRFKKARGKLDEIVYRFIREHRESEVDRGDLLSMLLLEQDAEGGTGGMSDRQLRDEAMTIFLAGHETTAAMLSWTWHQLAQNPEVEARLHAELDSVLGGRTPSVEDLRKLPYTEMVLSESMRLAPPAWAIGRIASADTEIGGVALPKGWAVVMSQWVVHRDARLWPDPLRFDPERFTPERKAARHKFAYFPFGGGPRVCIGDGFAWTSGILMLATLAQRWRLKSVPGHPVVPLPRVTLRMKHGLKMTLERRVPVARASAVAG